MFLNVNLSLSNLLSKGLNRKHEMFLNEGEVKRTFSDGGLNRKHEMFLNKNAVDDLELDLDLTVNMKCF